MINRLITLIIIFFVTTTLAVANSFKFEAKNIEIFKDKNKIIAGKGKAFSSDDKLVINADKFEYLKDINLLRSNGNGKAIINSYYRVM